MNLKHLIKFGMEESQEPVIKNPILRAALEEPRSMAQAPLAEDLEPGALRDEMLKGFDPSQETHEEYLQRINLERPFNAAHGGRIGFSEGLSAKAEAMKKLDAAKVANPSKEAMDEISSIIDKYIVENKIGNREIKHLNKNNPIDKIFKEVKTPGYQRPSVAKELFKKVLESKEIIPYENYRTNKIVFTLTDVLRKNKGDVLSIKPSAIAEILPEFAIEGTKGGKGFPIFKTFINYLEGSERLGSRAGLDIPKQIAGKPIKQIISEYKQNFLEIPGGRARGNFTVFEEAKLLDRLANENPALKPSQLEKLYKENGGKNFKQRLKDLIPAKTGQSVRGSHRGKSILEAVKKAEISNSLPKSLRSAYAFYTKDYNWSRLIRQAELFRKDKPELSYRFIKGSDIFRKGNLERLGITGVVGEHALPISAIKTANADIDTFLKIDAFVDRELNNWKAKNFDEAIFAPGKGLADKYKKAKGADKIKIKNEIIERLNYMKQKAPELMKNVSFDFTNGIFTAKSSTAAIDTLSDDAIKALATKGSDIKTTFIKNAGDAVEPTDTGGIKTIKDSFIKPKPVVLGSNLANIDADMFDFRKLPEDMRHFADITKRYAAESPKLLSALKKAKGAGKWTGWALAGEPVFAAPFAEYGYKMGESPERIWGDATFGLLGETEQEELKKAVGERGYATQQIDNYGSQLGALKEKWESLNDHNDPRGEQRQVIENIYNNTVGKYNKAYNMFVDDQGEFDKDKYDQALNTYTAGLVQIDKFKKQKQDERIAKAGGYEGILQEREVRNIKGFAQGGIASLKK